MKFKEIKSTIENEWLTIFETFSSCNVLREENNQLLYPDEPNKWDDYEVLMISGKGDCELYVYLEHKEKVE
jgi:hypothetical protein